ncbi:YhcH/YjgK/YiaL family protein [Ekhidna sp.]|uniref:YhcH/YjgK/YiaL family protein n=1 Tax=Ekhidna sp. TaxID=2608089 RepID=UPI003B5104F2
MAIIGSLTKVRKRYFHNKLDVVFDYLSEALSENSTIRKRIFSRHLGAFEKVALTEDIFALEQVFETKNRDNCFWESHLKYVDFQLNLSGVEQMEFCDIQKMSILEQYDTQKDLIIYRDLEWSNKFIMQAGDLAVYYPEDAHMGLPWYERKKCKVYKTVVKVPLNLLR